MLTITDPSHPQRVKTDKVQKFVNSDFQALMKRYIIQHFAYEGEQQTVVVKGFNRTIKTKIWTYLSDRGTVRWLDVIQNLVDAYNHSRDRSIGIEPADFQKKDEDRLWVRFLADGDTHLKPPIIQGAMVRVSRNKTILDTRDTCPT